MGSQVEFFQPYLTSTGPTLITIICVIWLAYRISSLLVLPVPHLIRLLSLSLPPTPTLTLDSLTSTSLSLHWDIPNPNSKSANTIAKHLIQLNGRIIGESDRRDTSVMVTGLKPGEIYVLRVVACNTGRLHSRSEILRVRTLEGEEGLEREFGDDGQRFHPPVVQTQPAPFVNPSYLQSLSSRRLTNPAQNALGRRLSNASKIVRSRSNSNSAPVTQINGTNTLISSGSSTPETLASLTLELDRIIADTKDVELQITSEIEKNTSENTKLQQELEDLRARRKEDEESKSALRSETKALEESKRSVDATKSRLERQLRGLQDELSKLESEASARLQDLADREQGLQDLSDLTGESERRALECQVEGKSELDVLGREIAALEESNRELSILIAKLRGTTTDDHPSGADDGNVHTGIRRRKSDASSTRSAVMHAMRLEDERDTEVEKEWLEIEKDLKGKMDDIQRRLDEANREYRGALTALVQARESHTQSLPHTGSMGRRRKNRTRRGKGKAALGGVGASPNLTAADLSSTAGSRPSSLINLPPPADFNSQHPTYSLYSAEGSPPYGTHASPWASTHSLGLVQPSAEERDVLAAGAPLSPSLSEHLLPSNLFKDFDDSTGVRTSPYIERLIRVGTPPSRSLTGSIRRPNLGTPIRGESSATDVGSGSSYSSPGLVNVNMTSPDTPSIVIAAMPDEGEIGSPTYLGGLSLSGDDTDSPREKLESEDGRSSIGPDGKVKSGGSGWGGMRMPSISFKRNKISPVTPEKRLPLFGSFAEKKSRSMPKSVTLNPIGFNRPRSGSGSTAGSLGGSNWVSSVTRARAPSETGRQFDREFDPLESRRILEGVTPKIRPSGLSKPLSLKSTSDDKGSSDNYSTWEFRRNTDPAMGGNGMEDANLGGPNRTGSLPSSPNQQEPRIHRVIKGETSLVPHFYSDRTWSPPPTGQSGLDPKAPEFKFEYGEMETLRPSSTGALERVTTNGSMGTSGTVRNARGGLFTLTRRGSSRAENSFLNTFTGMFRREAKNEEEIDGVFLGRPMSQESLVVEDHETTGYATPSTPLKDAEVSSESKVPRRKDKFKGKSKGLFSWGEGKEGAELGRPRSHGYEDTEASMEDIDDILEFVESKKEKKKKDKKERTRKEEEPEGKDFEQEKGVYYHPGSRKVKLEDVSIKFSDYFR